MSRLSSLVLPRSTALLLLLLGGCGGRTTFDPAGLNERPVPSPNDSTGSGGSGSVGSTGVGGTIVMGGRPTNPGGSAAAGNAPSSGKGGAAPIPGTGTTGGSSGFGGVGYGKGGTAPIPGTGAAAGFVPWGGTGGLDPEIVTNSCEIYCKVEITSACPTTGSFNDCIKTCTSELEARSSICQQVGIDLLSCITGVFQSGKDCNQIEQYASAKCSGLEDAYQRCVAPIPTPVPTTCATAASYGDNDCSLVAKCDSGAYYNVSCFLTSSFQSDCSCIATNPDGSSTGVGFTLNEQGPAACEDTLAACGYPQPGLK